MTEPLQCLEGVTCTAAAQISANVGNKTGTAEAGLVDTYAWVCSAAHTLITLINCL